MTEKAISSFAESLQIERMCPIHGQKQENCPVGITFYAYILLTMMMGVSKWHLLWAFGIKMEGLWDITST